MGEKRKVYEALVDGAMDGLTDDALFKFVTRRCPKTSSKKIVRAALLGLTDPHLRDKNILDTIYALAIKHRMDEFRDGEDADDERDSWPAPFAREPDKKTVRPDLAPDLS
ncbi:Hypothetical protein RG1141_CH22380 [Neorhizobium galegae bv. officinalis bv. officinalis str. HAMBI 1141]|jgi:hypothetical protein|uniref:Uncharacterized protein n=1 Tax=Neorhizobium galegae bv. officinalis bv. officinalis str. HAMBI 1141 TaxID=1028801 RepID=A0A068T7R9_NEOGA|nr:MULTISPECIES: hypothetical protein [Neorhizobium]MCJ9753482.1 hypothetical protein [Neorhizobium sp. BETTINA12A]CDN54577.1 Hypothetical protein RG1141_CH22380 [Neorhizobium galegae bv. officinalis bv. officinalis str. HAMBI 1141]